MNIESITSTIKSIPQTAKNLTDTVGGASIKYAKQAGSFVAGKLKLKKPENFDTFIANTKENAPEFVKTAGRFVKNNKETFVGGAVILAAVASAIAIVKSIAGKVKQAKVDKIAMHQG